MLLLLLFVAANCGKFREYDVEMDTFIHISTEFREINEGGNPTVYVDNDKIGLFTFDFDEDFKSHEIVSAKLKLEVTGSYGDGDIIFCFLEEADFTEGTGSFYGTPDQVYPTSSDGATHSTIDGTTTWDFENLIYCTRSSKEKILNHYRGTLEFDATKLVEKFSEKFSAELLPKTMTFVIGVGSDFLSVKIKSGSAQVIVETADKTEIFSGFFDEIDEVHISITPENLAILDDAPTEEEYVPCDITYRGVTYENGGCRYKGGTSTLNNCCRWQGGILGQLNPDACRKLSFKFDTDKFADEKVKLLNQKKLNYLANEPVFRLVDGCLDGTCIDPWKQGYDQVSAMVGNVLTQMCDIEMALSKYSTIYVNDEYWGLYTMVEQTDDQFIEDRFWYDDNEGDSQLWKEPPFNHPTAEQVAEAREEGDKKVEDMAWFVGITDAIEELDVTSQDTKQFMLDNFDMNVILRLLAKDELIGNLDGLQYFKCSKFQFNLPEIELCEHDEFLLSNVYIYRLKVNGAEKMLFIDHDLDNTGAGNYPLRVRYWYDTDFEPEVCLNGEVALSNGPNFLFNLPPQCTKFFQAIRTHFMDEYKLTVEYLANNVITEDAITELIDTFANLIEDTIEDEPLGTPTEEEWEVAVENIKQRMLLLRQGTIDRVSEL